MPFVEVGQSGYDTHADNFTGHKGLLPPMDHAWAGLLDDLEHSGWIYSASVPDYAVLFYCLLSGALSVGVDT